MGTENFRSEDWLDRYSGPKMKKIPMFNRIKSISIEGITHYHYKR